MVQPLLSSLRHGIWRGWLGDRVVACKWHTSSPNPCIGVKDASCVEVCPVDCIQTTDEADMFYIDPEICIDCSYCESVCPVNAIFDEFAVPSKWRPFILRNKNFFDGK